MILAATNCLSENVLVQAIVIPKLELGNVERQVLEADLVIGADNATLNQAPENFESPGVDSRQLMFRTSLGHRSWAARGRP